MLQHLSGHVYHHNPSVEYVRGVGGVGVGMKPFRTGSVQGLTGFLFLVKEAQTYAEDTGLLFMETSAKTAMNVNELFLAIG